MRSASSLALPFLLLGGLVYLTRSPARIAMLQELAHALPYLLLATAGLLGLRFNRSRVVLAVLLLVLADGLLRGAFGLRWSPAGSASGAPLAALLTSLLPLYLAVFALLSERGLLSGRAVVRLVLLLSPAVALLVLGHKGHPLVLKVLGLSFLPWLRSWLVSPLPDLALAAFALSAVVLGVLLVKKRTSQDSAFLVTLIVLALALHAPTRPAALLLLAGGGLILALAVVQESYGMAYLDELTRLPGRRALNEELLKLGRRYSVAMLDVDHFKKFNDRYGHDVGDDVLRLVAKKMSQVGGGGRPFRYGGEEFTVLFPRRNSDQVVEHLEALRQKIAEARLTLRSKDRPKRKPKKPVSSSAPRQQVSVTISIGVADSQADGRTPSAVLEAADKALYRAKRQGRNRVSR